MLAAALSVLALLQSSAVGPTDADTRAWWQRTSVLSADSMEGRDAGSRGHEHAARHVARLRARGARGGPGHGAGVEGGELAAPVTAAGCRHARPGHDAHDSHDGDL